MKKKSPGRTKEQILTSFRYAFSRNSNIASFHSTSQRNVEKCFSAQKKMMQIWWILKFHQDQVILIHTNNDGVLLPLQAYVKSTDPIQPGEIKKLINRHLSLNTSQEKPTQPSEHCFRQTVPWKMQNYVYFMQQWQSQLRTSSTKKISANWL